MSLQRLLSVLLLVFAFPQRGLVSPFFPGHSCFFHRLPVSDGGISRRFSISTSSGSIGFLGLARMVAWSASGLFQHVGDRGRCIELSSSLYHVWGWWAVGIATFWRPCLFGKDWCEVREVGCHAFIEFISKYSQFPSSIRKI